MSRRTAVLAAALVSTLAVGTSATASTVTFTAPTIMVAESPTPQTYTADVLISDTNTADIISDFQLDLFLQPTNTFSSASPGGNGNTNVAYGANTGFDFVTTSVTNGPAEPYLYNNSLPGNANNSNSINFSDGGYLTTYTTALSGPGIPNEVYGADAYATNDAAQMTQTWALARIYITVAANFTGVEYLVWNNNGINNDSNAPFYSLSSAQATPLDPNLVGGMIIGCPEPSAIGLMCLGTLGLCAAGWRRKRRASILAR